MFVRTCLFSVLAMSALAGPTAAGDEGAVAKWSEEGERQPIVMAQLQRFISPHFHMPRPSPRRGYGHF